MATDPISICKYLLKRFYFIIHPEQNLIDLQMTRSYVPV